MKAIKLLVKTAGFKYGDIVEIGAGKGKITSEIAEKLVKEGHAEEYGKGLSIDSKKGELESQLQTAKDQVTEAGAKLSAVVKEAEEAKSKIETLEAEKLELIALVTEAIELPKGTAPKGFDKFADL